MQYSSRNLFLQPVTATGFIDCEGDPEITYKAGMT